MTSIAPELPGEQQRHAEDQSPMHLQEEEEASAAAGPGITVSLDGTDDDRAVGGRADDARSAARMDGGAPSSQHVDEQELMNLTRHTDSFGDEDGDGAMFVAFGFEFTSLALSVAVAMILVFLILSVLSIWYTCWVCRGHRMCGCSGLKEGGGTALMGCLP